MPECAFCEHAGKLSVEHVTSKWIGELFNGPAEAWFGTSEDDRKPFKTETLDFKAKVVCQTCNNTWMSDIESKAKPILTPLITGDRKVLIAPDIARTAALFAFKTAVIVDHMRRAEPFFPRRFRSAFRKDRFIPRFTQMWMCAVAGGRPVVRIAGIYHKGKTPDGLHLYMYTCTCAFGHFGFQVLSVHQSGTASFRSTERFKEIAVPFWPSIPPNFVWPHRKMLRLDEDFRDFSMRWQNINMVQS